MEIRLDMGSWEINGYIITGDKEDGYYVYPENDDGETAIDWVYENKDFEKCLTWVYNS